MAPVGLHPDLTAALAAVDGRAEERLVDAAARPPSPQEVL